MATAHRNPKTRKARVNDLKLNTFQRKVANKVVVPAIVITNFALLAISLEHLATGIESIFNQAMWICIAAAVAIDTGMIVAELTCITMGTKLKVSSKYAVRYVIGTVIASMLLNSMAFLEHAEGIYHQTLAVIAGIAIPAGIWTLTRMAGGVWLAANQRKGG